MEFDIKICAIFIMKSGQRQMTKGIKLPNQETIGPLGEKNCNYLGILKPDTIKQAEMKEKITKAFHRRKRKRRYQVV